MALIKNTPLVSIAVATYNGLSHIREQIDSLLAQDYPNIEIVISDDFSTDGTWEVLQGYAIQDQRIRLLSRDFNRGYVKNFIRAFMECRGEVIAPSDQDDIWYSSKISRLMERLGENDLVYCNSRFVDEGGKAIGKTLADTIQMVSGNDPRKLVFCTSVCGHAMAFRSNLLEGNIKLASTSYIDWMIAFLAASRNGICYVDETLVDWRQHSDSLTLTVRKNTLGSKLKVLGDDMRTIDALSKIPGKYQSFIMEANQKLKSWHRSYFNLGMFLFVLRYGKITHSAHPAKFPSLKYLFGYKLKKLLRPNYY